MGWVGFNCSLPHKVAVIEHLDGLGDSAALMGAVNCVVRRREGQYIGENTDGKGFLKSLQEHIDPQGKQVVMFGAGGAARAVSVELALAGVQKITVVNRSVARGRELYELLDGKVKAATGDSLQTELVAWTGDFDIPPAIAVVINATSIGLYPDLEARLALNLNTLKPNMVVADIIPNPPQTRLIREAAARGCTVIDGLGMLVNQGVISLKYWTGLDVEPTVMRAKVEEIFG
jgi:shikimate dehydrogenase